MSYNGLNSFIKELELKQEIIRIKEKVSPNLQITEIADRMIKSGGKALLFENNGSKFPLLINAYGSEQRICMALGVQSLENIGEQIMKLLNKVMTSNNSVLSKLSLLPTLAEVSSFLPKHLSKRGECQQVIINNPDLSQLPIITCWPHDGGPYITLPIVHTQHPITGIRNVGMYRMQVLSNNKTGMHWHLHKNSASHYREYKQLGKRMPVSVVLGGDPVYSYVATAPLPENIDEYMLAGFLRKEKVTLVKCITNDIYVPNDADIVLEGYIDTNKELILEGPFGDHTGFYSLADYYPAFHISCITHRHNAVYPATIVGIPPQEDKWLGKATERIFLPLIKLGIAPEIEDMIMPDEGVFHNLVLVSIKKSYSGQAIKVMNALWGAGQMMFNKVLIIVDDNINLTDNKAIIKAIMQYANPENDIVFSRGPVDVLDHSSAKFAFGGKMGIDATRKLESETTQFKNININNLTSLKLNNELQANFHLLSEGIPILIVGIKDKSPTYFKELHSQLAFTLDSGIQYIIFIDIEAINIPISDMVWLVANNIDPSRDCWYLQETKGKHKMPLCIDGTRKTMANDEFERKWPNIVTMNQETIDFVDTNWERFGLGNFIPSPSSRYKALVKNEGAEVI